MRARNIKPGFFKNELLAELDPLGRILFAGLWCMADREGRLEDRPRRIGAEVLPYDNCDTDALLKDLDDAGFILRYEAEGTGYIQVVEFEKHQNPHSRESASTIPKPDKALPRRCLGITKAMPSPADSLIPDSLITDSMEKHMCGLTETDPLKEQAREVIEYLNEQTISRFRLTGKSVDKVLARLREGFTVEDCRTVIDGQKLDPYFLANPKFFRPETLFGSKFEGYLSAAPKQRAALETDPKRLIKDMRAEAEVRRFLEGATPKQIGGPTNATTGQGRICERSSTDGGNAGDRKAG